MATRVIRHGFLDSEKVNAMSDAAQNFFIRLMLVADDYGRFDARPNILASQCFPLGQRSAADCSKLLQENIENGLVLQYSVFGKNYLLIQNFGQRLRTMRSKYPEPPQVVINQQCPQPAADCGGLRPVCASFNESESESETNSKRSRNEAEKEGESRGGTPNLTPASRLVHPALERAMKNAPR